MKLNVTDGDARVLLDRLKDEQPDSPLVDLRRQVEWKLNPKPGQPLTADELDAVLRAVVALADSLGTVTGNPTKAQREQQALLVAAMPKLATMRDRQKERELAAES